MAWRNTADSWGAMARTFHWGFVFAIIIEVPVGFIMSRTYMSHVPAAASWHYWTSNVHHTLGLLILALMLLRVTWRLTGPLPDPSISSSKSSRLLAKSPHWLLYLLLILIPLSGWAALSSLADSAAFGPTILWFFGSNGFEGVIPRIVPPLAWDSNDLMRYSLFAKAHVWLLIAGAVLLALHIAAAFRHHFVLRDATLNRMIGRLGRR